MTKKSNKKWFKNNPPGQRPISTANRAGAFTIVLFAVLLIIALYISESIHSWILGIISVLVILGGFLYILIKKT